MAVSCFIGRSRPEAFDDNSHSICCRSGYRGGDRHAGLRPWFPRSLLRPNLQIVSLGLSRSKEIAERDRERCIVRADRRGRRLRSSSDGDLRRVRGRLSVGTSDRYAVGCRLSREHAPSARCRDRSDARCDRRAPRVGGRPRQCRALARFDRTGRSRHGHRRPGQDRAATIVDDPRTPGSSARPLGDNNPVVTRSSIPLPSRFARWILSVPVSVQYTLPPPGSGIGITGTAESDPVRLTPLSPSGANDAPSTARRNRSPRKSPRNSSPAPSNHSGRVPARCWKSPRVRTSSIGFPPA